MMICFISLFFSCSKITPAGFWNNYQSKFLLRNISDQGPYGGHRAMYWMAEKHGTFNSRQVLEFATKNGWKLVDSLEFNETKIATWNCEKGPIFPLTFEGFQDSIRDLSTCKYFPRWINKAIKIYCFKTGWITIVSGNSNSFEENGFVVLNKDGTEMSVYHLWGE